MANLPTLHTLPTDLLNDILLRIGSSSITDLSSCKIALREFNELSQQAHFLRNVDLFFMHCPNRLPGPALTAFRLSCLHNGNPSALVLKGVSHFFRLHLLEEGLAMLAEGANREGMLAKYCYHMLRLVMDGNPFGFSNFALIPRVDAVKLRTAIADSDRRAWTYPLPVEFVQRKQILGNSIAHSKCGCLRNNWSRDAHEKVCNSCFWKEEAYLYCETMPDHVLEWPY